MLQGIMALDENLQTVRHSLSHVMAEAVVRLFPGTKLVAERVIAYTIALPC